MQFAVITQSPSYPIVFSVVYYHYVFGLSICLSV